MIELLTAVRYKTPITSVVFYNRQWGAEKKNQVDFYGHRFEAADLENLDIEGLSRGTGAECIMVDQLDQVGPALTHAVDLQMNQQQSCVIGIHCTRELGDPFRRDALRKPVRHLSKYKDFV